MTDIQPPSRGTTPGAAAGVKRTLEEDHIPAISSPLNPDSAARPRPSKPLPREQREKRDTLKKRESTVASRAQTPDSKARSKLANAPAPLNYIVEKEHLKLSDFEAPKGPLFQSHEPPLYAETDRGTTELRRPLDHARGNHRFRYYPCVADPLFSHKQYFRQSDNKPFAARLSYEDSDKWIHFDESATVLTNERGWRMARANVVAREGKFYYEVKIIRGGSDVPKGQEHNPQPHIRVGWARREAPLDAPVGFDGYSYGVKDIGSEVMHKSRPSKMYKQLPKSSKRSKTDSTKYVDDFHIKEGDVIGLEINLPSISLHRRIVDGSYNPAVDMSDGHDDPLDPAHDIIRDRIAVPHKGNNWFEVNDYQPTKQMETYADRTVSNPVKPSPNHPEVPLRSLPHSSIKVYKNGKLVGTAFEGLMSFLPPASTPVASLNPLVRAGFDDGMLGYFPAVAAFCGGIAEVNLGPDFAFPPPGMVDRDVDMVGSGMSGTPLGRQLRPVGDRYKEQIAEDIVWDIVDDVGFFVEEERNAGRTGAIRAPITARGIQGLAGDDGI